ncbi:hypothetical protein [Candidatus Nanohalobium constans]|uniref:CARDB domain-containing protein n=1 Tax=Candidatus Nanohalobium constans TaxID=2565781 RepID=A0A5Q0UGP8_9ARCH|nr:hypothetical protein [Candidatus Nanohalobium constans]QGA80798.1 hypothetical protein LC1Nh_0916 [Candidatus Nanohalobium constans]
MNNTKQLIILFTIAVAASGCANTTPSNTDSQSTTTFIDVNTFEAIPNPVPSGEQITLDMELENTGDAEAEDVAARIFGPSVINQKSAGERTKSLGNLRSSSDTSFPGRTSWSINTNQLSSNREVNYDINANIFYGYETRADTEFKFVSRERFREQDYSRGEATIENSEAPIEIGIRGTTPITFDSNEGNPSEQVCITVENTGSGQAFTDGDNAESREYNLNDAEKDTVELVIDEIAGMEMEPEENTDVENNARNGEEARVDVNLIEGTEGWQCFTLRPEESLQNSETDVNTLITAEYNYKEETSTSATVEGRRGDSSNSDGEDGDTWKYKDSADLDSNDYEALETSWEDIEDGSDPSETCPALRDTDTEAAEDKFEELCSEE